MKFRDSGKSTVYIKAKVIETESRIPGHRCHVSAKNFI